MNFIHDVIKDKYIKSGWLPDYPYHLISDREMFNAFLNDSKIDYFHTTYPYSGVLSTEYSNLISYMTKCIDNYLTDNVSLPDWIYSYMLGAVISSTSTVQDRHDLLVLLHSDNLYDELTDADMISCYEISKSWIATKLADSDRPPTMFGEPHVIKSLRLSELELS